MRCDLMREGVLSDAVSIPLEANGQTSWRIEQAFPGADTSDFAGRCAAPRLQMHDCPNRAILDQAAAQVLRIDGRTIADWRERIAREPTVSGKLKGKASLFCGEAGTARV